jgi:glycosyltransferase involved in cell wall biosynthesis
MKVTTAICTRNRPASLRNTFASLVNVQVPKGLEWELILVDNGTGDSTSDVVNSFKDKLPIKYLREPQPGLSVARNRAIQAAQGDYLIWTDDDVLVNATWLGVYVSAFAKWPSASFFGGRIIPLIEAPSPVWFRDNWRKFSTALAHRDFGDEPILLNASTPSWQLPFGANFAVAMQEQKKYLFDARLGAAPGRSRVGEETELLTNLVQDGKIGYYLPDATVQHVIGLERQTLQYLENYYKAVGETFAFQKHLQSPNVPGGVPNRLWAQLPVRWLRYRVTHLYSAPDLWLERLKSYSFACGEMRYWRGKRTPQTRRLKT